MNNLIINFVDWHIENSESKYFGGDRDTLIANLSEYAVEFAKSFDYNPFVVDKRSVDPFVVKLEHDVYRDDTSFAEFSKGKSNDTPQALLGKKNYLKFLRGLSDEKEGLMKLKATTTPQVSNYPYHYEREELRKNFTFRLITQDRYYEFLYFPVSVLKKLFCKHNDGKRRKFFENWINKQIDHIALHTSPTSTLLFKDINALDINEDGTVLINKTFKLHTVVAGKEGMEEMKADTLENIVIDHVVPFEKILHDLKEQLPALRIIHNTLENINKGRISNSEDLKNAGNYLVSNVEFTDAELNAIEQEMNLILDKIQLQLMDRYQNLYKKRFKS